jgi:site-specific recombinase XerD
LKGEPMLEKLFVRCELQRYLDAPLRDERERYLEHLDRSRAARISLRLVAGYQLIILKYLCLEDGRLVTAEEVTIAGDRWAEAQTTARAIKRPEVSKKRFVSFASRWLSFLGRLELRPVVVHPYADTIAAFTRFLCDDRMLAAETVEVYCRRIGDFLTQLHGANVPLADVEIGHIDRILTRKRSDNGWARSTIRAYIEALRCFLKFAEQCRLCRKGLLPQLLLPRLYKHEGLPVGPSWEDVERLCASAAGDGAVDIRDRAIILLFSVYALRRSEVARLTLDDFDWVNSTIQIRRSKQVRRTGVYPLSQSVGEAIIRYLKEVRPLSQHRELFLRLQAPLQPLSGAGLARVISVRMKALKIRLRHYGPHALRHACACRLLAEGVSMKAIGDHLGHASAASTGTYAKVDVKALRAVAEFSLEGLL